ncbi:hypothetical protein B9Z19DRAFT_1137606 [Tuber borchii]|uniref:Uncharacterized protein n=1 Tax=Tuber borchii TaxID=42251 RepID=A0A2T6ZAB1_TUBBO|nr:hypothetical protein B9Z19DRAFT_1137606 [Tuber borchii]
MPALAEPDPDAAALFNGFLSSLSSFFKAKRPFRRPIIPTSPEGDDSVELKTWDRPFLPPSWDSSSDSLSPSPPFPAPAPPPTTPVEPPTGWQLEPAGPEKEPWWRFPGLQKSDEYKELVSNQWNDMSKRSVQYSNHAGAAISKALEGDYRPSYFQELPLVMFVFLVTMFAGAAALSAVVRTEKRLRPRLTQCLEKLEDDQHMYAALYSAMYCAVIFSLLTLLLLGVFGLHQLLLLAIWG